MSDEEKDQKIHAGYHGWWSTVAKTTQDFTPARIDSSEVKEAPTSVGKSAWNSAGTWEERDKSQWACDQLKQHIMNSFRIEDSARKVSIAATSIVRCEGDAKVVFSRGKKRCGYDIALKFAWTSTRVDDDADQVSGNVEIRDFDDMTGEDYEVDITTDGNGPHGKDATKAILSWENELRQLFATWRSELLEQ